MIDNHDEVIFNLKIELESLRPNIINHHFNLCESAEYDTVTILLHVLQ